MSTAAVSASRRWSARRLVVLALVVAIAAAAAYVFVPRAADLTRFDPAAMARRETRMWRDYYDKRSFALFLDLYATARWEQGFSPWDSVRLAFAAARAARAFQPTASRAGAEAAVPLLADYFAILAKAAPVPVDVGAAARAELDWWQARREAVGPAEYGLTVARVSTLLYGVDNAEIRRSGLVRADAMAYRDARGVLIADSDWAEIEARLRASYSLLKRAVVPPVR